MNVIIQFAMWNSLARCCGLVFDYNETNDINQFMENAGYPRSGDIPLLNRKIVRGYRVTISEHPYVASVRRLHSHYLTGALLTRNVVVTVAHPLVGVPIYELGVVMGESYADRGTTMFTVVLIVVHEKFDPYTLQADLSMLRLYENINDRFPFEFAKDSRSYLLIAYITYKLHSCVVVAQRKETIDPSILYKFNFFLYAFLRKSLYNLKRKKEPHFPFEGNELCLARSSRYYPDEWFDPMLRTVTFTMDPSNYYCNGYIKHDLKIYNGMMCLGSAREDNPVAPCLAVPGAPLVVHARLVGLQSWGFGCGYGHDLPLIYTNITTYSGWILQNTVTLRDIEQQNLTKLYKATKAYIATQWLIKTRVVKPTLQINRHKNLESMDVDKKLIELRGTVYDVRDFIANGRFRDEKRDMLSGLVYAKQHMHRLKLILEDRKIGPVKTFLSHELLKDVNLWSDTSVDTNDTDVDVEYDDDDE